MKRPSLKVALVGCGQIADAHLAEIRKIRCASAVAVCDRHLDLAKQAAARFEVPGVYDDLGRMLDEVRPDVVHVTTPPHSHRPLALQILEAGAHVYIEKPFSVDAADAEIILDAAKSHGRLVCVGHDQLLDPAWVACRKRIDSGEIGRVVHVESIQGYDLSGPFGRALSGDPGHWVHRLPGGLFQNVMSHALYRITDLMPDARPRAWARWLEGAASCGFPAELRAEIWGETVSANLIFSSTMRGTNRLTRVYGTRAALEVDLDTRVVRKQRSAGMPGAFAKIEMPLRHLGEATRSWGRASWGFAMGRIHYFEGMRRLFEAFYEAVAAGGEPPIAYSEIYRVTALMDAIFRSCRSGNTIEEDEVAPTLKAKMSAEATR